MVSPYILIEAATRAGMTGWAGRVNKNQQSVPIAIHFYLDHFLSIAGCGAFVPQLLPGT
jgi:hypothetical protein